MSLTPRQNEMLAMARASGRLSVDGLARDFAVTPQTIRRDLNDLCGRGLLTRVHGGAMPANGTANVAYEERRAMAFAEKARIGAAAAALIPDSCSLILNIGTTTEQVAEALREHRDLVVITNNINVVSVLRGSPTTELILAGGVVRQSDGGIVGEAAVDFIRQFKVDWAVIGASALDEDGAILDFDYREVSVARAIVENARNTILVADRSKFERSAPVRICDLSRIDHVVTDAEPPARFRRACTRDGVSIHVTTPDGDGNRGANERPEGNDANE
ncbi:DeoR/GlpR transcriptional regulator [Marivibrio halodurans]|uniref:DeoR/GlpR transcriptional regulator n=1 Tax=Marivibrio halodurans TaxID=2039722 RepID=A0A8J7S6M9_9PROT|nr:DeoR/GlpR family DNA-binding transcription regulator [Marivibrio halodurans]MBP5856567.1 DeoR/GlpR transcriptional regulator [Marivibrio halodurans]